MIFFINRDALFNRDNLFPVTFFTLYIAIKFCCDYRKVGFIQAQKDVVEEARELFQESHAKVLESAHSLLQKNSFMSSPMFEAVQKMYNWKVI